VDGLWAWAVALPLAAALGAAGAWLALSQRRRRRTRAVRRREQEIAALTRGLAHEIKNPLSTIGLNAQLLAEALEELEIDPGERERLVRRAGSLSREAVSSRALSGQPLSIWDVVPSSAGPIPL